MNEYFVAGFMNKCASAGLSQEQAGVLLKKALFAWGGKNYHLGTGKGVGGDLGYTYLMGTVPLPYAGLRVGGEDFGLSAGGPLPYIGIDSGVSPGWRGSSPRSLWQYAADGFAPAEEALTKELEGLGEDATEEQILAVLRDRGYRVDG